MRALVVALVLVLSATAFALEPSDRLSDPALEARAHAIASEVRCLVCQNQSIEESEADLARQLRRIVRERVAAGDSDAEVRQYLVDRYGEFVLLRPVVGWHTILLWAAAPLLLLIGVGMLVFKARARRREEPPERPITAEEKSALDSLAGAPDRSSHA